MIINNLIFLGTPKFVAFCQFFFDLLKTKLKILAKNTPYLREF